MKKILLTTTLLCFVFSSNTLTAQENPPPYPWLDDLHLSLTSSVHDTANWLDTFFVNDSLELDQDAHGYARIRLAWEPRSRNFAEFESRLRVSWKLPKFKNQVSVVFSDYDEDLDQAPVKAAQNDVIEDQNRFNLALRWIRNTDNSKIWSHRIGIGRQLQPFVRTRLIKKFAMGEGNNLRTEVSGYYYAKDGFGSHLGLQYEHGISENSVLRFDNHLYYRGDDNDWLWRQSLYMMHQVNERSAFIHGVYVEGESEPNYQVTEYLVSSRWRKNALREWLFFEVEPFVLWSREDNFSASYGVALRVEGFFGHL
ncbi:hypothetical protein [Alteromonas sp. a30]|uniref:hypothetical protein n=1 Tax=Alteromonas sp. a30 TaxID=2730917 RepID=UPI0022825555|nr:hypothetical protein [Alteromonas sp. a30]MCY7295354.1 hypothetical protein [Alteromonas sp. a30]